MVPGGADGAGGRPGGYDVRFSGAAPPPMRRSDGIAYHPHGRPATARDRVTMTLRRPVEPKAGRSAGQFSSCSHLGVTLTVTKWCSSAGATTRATSRAPLIGLLGFGSRSLRAMPTNARTSATHIQPVPSPSSGVIPFVAPSSAAASGSRSAPRQGAERATCLCTTAGRASWRGPRELRCAKAARPGN